MKNLILFLLYFIAFIFAVFCLFLIFDVNPLEIQLEDKGSLLGAVGIILSAFIASLSVLISIDNTKKIEKDKRNKNLQDELNIFKLKTSILKRFLSLYFRDDSHYKEVLKSSNISEECMHHVDMSDELLDKLNNYELFIDSRVQNILGEEEIFKILENINLTIGRLRANENFKREPLKKGFSVTVSIEWTLVDDLEKLENRLGVLAKEKKGHME